MIWESTPELATLYVAQIALAVFAGAILGLIYYGGLWWTVRRLQTTQQTGLLFAASFVIRTVAVIAGFLLVSRGDWLLIVVALVPFIVVRLILTRRWGPKFEQ